MLGQSSGVTYAAGSATGGHMPLPEPGHQDPQCLRGIKDTVARASMEPNVPVTTTARATTRQAGVKAREGKDRVGEGEVG